MGGSTYSLYLLGNIIGFFAPTIIVMIIALIFGKKKAGRIIYVINLIACLLSIIGNSKAGSTYSGLYWLGYLVIAGCFGFALFCRYMNANAPKNNEENSEITQVNNELNNKELEITFSDDTVENTLTETNDKKESIFNGSVNITGDMDSNYTKTNGFIEKVKGFFILTQNDGSQKINIVKIAVSVVSICLVFAIIFAVIVPEQKRKKKMKEIDMSVQNQIQSMFYTEGSEKETSSTTQFANFSSGSSLKIPKVNAEIVVPNRYKAFYEDGDYSDKDTLVVGMTKDELKTFFSVTPRDILIFPEVGKNYSYNYFFGIWVYDSENGELDFRDSIDDYTINLFAQSFINITENYFDSVKEENGGLYSDFKITDYEIINCQTKFIYYEYSYKIGGTLEVKFYKYFTVLDGRVVEIFAQCNNGYDLTESQKDVLRSIVESCK